MRDNSRLSRFFLLVFLLVSLVDVLAILDENSLWQTIAKPLIIPSLMAYYIAASSSINKLYILALVFSFAGDVLLLDKTDLFLFGIGAFLITQVLYVYLFSKGLGNSPLAKKIMAFVPFSIFFVVLIRILKPGLEGFLIPVVIYGIAISIFGSISLLKYLVKKNKVNLNLFIGAVIFIISDSLIALHKFHEPRSFYPVVIMLTYIIAQYLIASFMLGSEKNASINGDS